MTRLAARTAETLDHVLAGFGVAGAAIHDIRAGRMNKHWRIVSPSAVYALRRYNPDRSPAAIGSEHAVLESLAERNWPVAPPLHALGGDTVVEADGARYALFPFLPGRPAPYRNHRYLRFKGALLARLHRDLAASPLTEQRDGFGRIDNLDAAVRDERFAGFDALLDAFGREHPVLARAVRRERERGLEECAALGFDRLPLVTVHADFHHDNILFRRGELTALLDFDLVHRDARIADVACSISLDCLLPPDHDTVDPAAARAFVAGYESESTLTAEEVALTVPMIRAQFLWLVAFRLRQWTAGPAERPLRSVERSVHRRFPGLDQGAEQIAAAVGVAARHPDILSLARRAAPRPRRAQERRQP